MRTCDAAVLVLRETENPAVMWGDTGLLCQIAARARLRTGPLAWQAENAVLRNLSRQPGDLVSGHTREPHGRRVRCFWLREHAPERLQTAERTSVS